MAKYSLGIDVSKKDLHVCLSLIGESDTIKVIRSSTFLNTKNGFGKLVNWITESLKNQPSYPLRIVMEATGIYYENCALYLHAHKFQLSVVLPNKAKKYLEASGIKTKNDKSDAKGLSRMGLELLLESWEPMDGYFYELRSLTRHHQALQEQVTVVKNQMEASNCSAYENKVIARSHKKILHQLETQLLVITQAISEHIAANEEVSQKMKQITRLKGLGELSVAVIIAETNGFVLFKNAAQLISYSGYDVVENQSGLRVGRTKISKKGNSKIRRVLTMPAFTAVKHEPSITTFYNRLLDRHGIKLKAYVAVQKKLLSLIYSLWKKNEAYDPNYIQSEKGGGAFSGGTSTNSKKISPAMQG